MRFRLGLLTGFASGYYLGTRAGRQRYDQINRSLGRLRRSEAFEQATDRAKTVVEEGVEKALSVVGAREGNGQGGDHGDARGIIVPGRTGGPEVAPGLILPGEADPTEPPAGPGDYSSSR